MTKTIDDTLTERGLRYGEFADHAEVTQSIKVSMQSGRNWGHLADDMKECLEMIAHKAGRILNGDPSYIDSWTDIIGYTRLVEKRLISEQAVPEPKATESMENMFLDAIRKDIDNRVSIGEKLAGAKPNPSKPSSEEVEAALVVLMAAGVVTLIDGSA